MIDRMKSGKRMLRRLGIPHLRPVTAFAVKVACFFEVRFCTTKRQGQAMALDAIIPIIA